MKITAVETLRVEEFPNLLWVIVETEDGLRGTGESFFSSPATDAYVHDTASALLLGQDARDREAIQKRLKPYVGYNGAGAEVRGNSASRSGGCSAGGHASRSAPTTPAPDISTCAAAPAR